MEADFFAATRNHRASPTLRRLCVFDREGSECFHSALYLQSPFSQAAAMAQRGMVFTPDRTVPEARINQGDGDDEKAAMHFHCCMKWHCMGGGFEKLGTWPAI